MSDYSYEELADLTQELAEELVAVARERATERGLPTNLISGAMLFGAVAAAIRMAEDQSEESELSYDDIDFHTLSTVMKIGLDSAIFYYGNIQEDYDTLH